MKYRKLLSIYYDLQSPGISKDEMVFWSEEIEKIDGKILYIGCGTGRVFIPLYQKYKRIVGLDASKDMLDRCKEKCRKLKIKPKMYKMKMEDFSLPEKFDLICIPDGSIGFASSYDGIKNVLQNTYKHLNPGKSFIFDYQPIPNKQALQDHGKWVGNWKKVNDDLIYCKRINRTFDPKTNLGEGMLILEKYQNERLVAVEENYGITRHYSQDEIIQLVTDAGFIDVNTFEWLSKTPLMPDSGFATLKCKKPI
jgi:SAM-dependent methyltransferase